MYYHITETAVCVKFNYHIFSVLVETGNNNPKPTLKFFNLIFLFQGRVSTTVHQHSSLIQTDVTSSHGTYSLISIILLLLYSIAQTTTLMALYILLQTRLIAQH